MEPAGADDEQFPGTLILANDDGAAPVGPLMLFKLGERKALCFRQPNVCAEPFSEATYQGLLTPNTLISGLFVSTNCLAFP